MPLTVAGLTQNEQLRGLSGSRSWLYTYPDKEQIPKSQDSLRHWIFHN